MPTSSRTSRRMQSSIDSPGSTKPASALNIAWGKRLARASSNSRPRVTSTIIAGDTRGYTTCPQTGQRLARSSVLSSVAAPQRPQKRWLRSHSTTWNARPATASSTSGILRNSERKPRHCQPSGSGASLAARKARQSTPFRRPRYRRVPSIPSPAKSESVGSAGGSAALTSILSSRQTKHSAADGSASGRATPGSKPAGVFITSNTLAQEPLVLADDGELHELRPVVVARREGDVEAAEVQVAHCFHRRDELLAGQVRTGATQSFHQHLGGDKAFEAGERIFLLAGVGFQELLILLDDGRREVPGKRHDLSDSHAAACRARFMRQRSAAYERDIHELGV